MHYGSFIVIRFVVGLLFIAGTMLGCAQNSFNVPADVFAEKVKVLGVAPIFIDTDSDILFPQKELLIPLISDLNRKYEPLLARKLQSTGNFDAVTLLADEPRQLFSSLFARREKRDDANIQYNKYFWKNDEIGAYLKKNRLDAVMIIVVSGLTKTSTIYSSNLLSSLETYFNFLTMTAQILGPDGTVLWEYPNFRGRILTYYPLANLQYPDFSESEANMSRKTEVRFKSLDGIRRVLEEKKRNWLHQETEEPEVYGRLFDEMISLIMQSVDKQAKGAVVDGKPSPPPAGPQKSGAALDTPAKATPKSAPARASVVKAPVQVATPKSAVVTTDAPANAPNEIVPASESTR
jgi:hypothetical protein